MKLLLHTCCGPCSIYPIQALKKKGHEITAYFYNPNIHPYKEFQKRKETLEQYSRQTAVPLWVDEEYGLEKFLQRVVHREQERCQHCYEMRLRQSAEKASEAGFDGFSTTLLVSPYQNHDRLKEIGETVAKEAGTVFVYEDFRPGFREAQNHARELDLYRQPYCGCIYSEMDRYYKPNKLKSGG